MPTRPAVHKPYPRRERAGVAPVAVIERREKTAARGYGGRWQKARRTFLDRHPFCAHCTGEGKTVLAKVVDHIVPHRGDQVRFWDTSNWQPLCKAHHDAKTAREDGGFGNRVAPKLNDAAMGELQGGLIRQSGRRAERAADARKLNEGRGGAKVGR